MSHKIPEKNQLMKTFDLAHEFRDLTDDCLVPLLWASAKAAYQAQVVGGAVPVTSWPRREREKGDEARAPPSSCFICF